MHTPDALPKEWRDWIASNLERGCDPVGMAQLMVKDGGYTAAVAAAAIARVAQASSAPEVAATGAANFSPIVRPEIDTSRNIIDLPDRQVKILMSLDQPRVVLIGNLLSSEECDELCAYTADRLTPSPVVDMVEGSNAMHEHRTSKGAMTQRAETELIGRIEERLSALTGWPVERGEGMQVLRYETGHEYRAHFDWFDPEQSGPAKHLAHGGQRLASIVMYLNDVEEGGGTSFPSVGLQTQPGKGCAVFFCNTDAFGAPDKLSLHAGMPVGKGVKMIATKWLRERTY